MFTFNSNNLILEYEIIGKGEPLIFIHGLGGDTNQIKSLYNPLEYIQLILINMQGHGNSQANYLTLDFNTMADDVIHLLSHLHISSAYFAGISMGAAILSNLAIRYPQYVKKMILIRPAWTHQPMDNDVRQAYNDLAIALSKQSKEDFLLSKGWQIVNQTTNYTRNTFLHTFEETTNVKEWQKFHILPSKAPFTSIQELQNISIPTIIIACKKDFVHPYSYGEYYHQYIANSILIEIPNKDKDPLLHNQQIHDIINKFL